MHNKQQIYSNNFQKVSESLNTCVAPIALNKGFYGIILIWKKA